MYTETFGGANVFPAQVSLLVLNITVNTTLAWPVEQALPDADVMAWILEVTATAGLSITFPDATLAGPGQAILVNNVGAQTITIKNNAGGVIGTVASGVVKQLYLEDNTTAAGTWRIFTFGTGASSADAAALAGAGLKAITTTLNVKIAPTLDNTTPRALANANRATAQVWTGGVGAWSLPAPAVVGSDWFLYLRNQGTGDLTVTPAAGTINGDATIVLGVDDSAIVFTDGANYFTIAFSSGASGFFDYTSINVAGTGNYILAGGELDRIAYKLTGVLTGARNIVVPATVEQYWVNNATSGAFDLTVKTLAGTGVVVPQGSAMLLYSDGSNVVAAEGAPLTGLIPVTLGGTGLSAVVQGDILYASAANVFSRLAKNASATRYISNTGASNGPAWAQVDLSTGVTNRLPYSGLAQGAALSVLGVAGNVVGDINQIVGGPDQVLRVSPGGTSLVFGAIVLSSTSAVTGSLGAQNGGTGQAAVTLGDMLYGDAANSWGRLPKDATGLKVLTNQGASNIPQWNYQRYTAGAAANSAYTFVLGDQWSWVPHTEASTARVWTIPTNAAVAYPLGTQIGIDNRIGSGAITLTAAGGVTLDGHGGGGVAASIAIPPGYKAIIVKMASDTWLCLTDAPITTGTGAIFPFYVAADGATGLRLPAGWSVNKTGTGVYEVTTGLGLADATRLSIGLATYASAGNKNSYIDLGSSTGSKFVVNTLDPGTGALTDQAFGGIATIN
jgi:hypothetical protein